MKHKFLFTLCFCALSGFSAYAQKVTMHFQKVKLEKVFGEITRQTGLTVAYSQPTVNPQRIVSVNTNKEELDAVLSRLFAGTGIAYEIGKQKIYLKSAQPQPKPSGKKKAVKGKVVDKDGEPIIGASVKVNGLPIGTVTDVDGNYSLDDVPEGSSVEISYIGYKQVSLKSERVEKQPAVTLEEDSKQLDEVVVVGYGTQNKKTLTGAVGSMDMKDIEATTVSSISQAMGGKVAGLQANIQSAQPGGAVKFRIRGEGSTGAGNEPLIVIDGFPVSSSGSLGSGTVYSAGSTDNILESLNPSDIESISVLKDAASTAIYGARAGHGVILITTKRGKQGKVKVNYSASGAIQKVRNNYDMLDVQQYMDVRNKQLYEEYLRANGLDIYKDYVTATEQTAFVPKYTNDQIARATGTDWLKEVTRTGYLQQHDLSVSGGSEKTRYMASLNYMRQNGIVKNNAATRLAARLNLDQDFNKYVSMGLTVSYSQNKYDNVPLGDGDNENAGILTAAIRANPALPIYDENGDYSIDPNRATFPNPVSLLEITDETVKDRLTGNAFIRIKPIDGLELKASFGADRRGQKRRNYLPKTTLQGKAEGGKGTVSYEDATDYLMDLTATYNKTFGDHAFKALVGYSYQRFESEGVTSANSKFLTDAFLYHNLGAGDYPKPTASSWASKNSLGSYFARVNYQYKDRYLVEGTIRADGQSNFNPDSRWGYFPSVSAGWVISEEKFMEKTRGWLSNMKLRASYGQTGNSNVGNRINSYYAVGKSYVLGGQVTNGVYTSELGNPNLTWETTTEWNVGLDLGFLNNRIRLTAEYFKRKITDMLVASKPLLSYNEVTTIADNDGSTQSKGFELTLNTVNFNHRNFEWNTTLTLARYSDRWLTRASNWKPAVYQKEDDPIRAWWSYRALGILQPGEKAPAAQANLLPGQVILEDRDGNGILDDNDLYYVDNGEPKIIYGFNNSFRYKRFDFNIYLYGQAGQKKGASYYEGWTSMGSVGVNVSTLAYETFSHSNLTATHPSTLASTYGYGDYYVKSVYYIRCGNMTLGYNIPVNKKWISNLRVYADVRNPFVITNWTGSDPETDTGTYSYPNTVSYNFGINLTF